MGQTTKPSALDLIAAERQRQIEVEGYTQEHDKAEHWHSQLAVAAACYALPAEFRLYTHKGWPLQWPTCWDWKPTPKDRIKELVKAGALIAAEIERLQNEPR